MKRRLEQSGYVLISIIIVLPFLLLIVAFYLQLATSSYSVARKDQLRTHAQFGADAGADFAVQQLNADDEWDGTTSPIELHNDGKTRVTYESSVEDIGDNKTITATGRTYSPVTHTSPDANVTIKVDLRPVSTGEFSLVGGVGGLELSNSAKIIGGSVYVNGEISMKNSSQIGLTTNPVNVFVANQACPSPADSTYPQLCASGENNDPITIENPAQIYGNVTANHQFDGSMMSSEGLVGSSGVEALPLPAYDREAQKAAVATTIDGSAASCSGSQTRTWTANTKITGNVSIANNCVVTVQGNVWITGTLTTRNSNQVVVADSLGETIPTIMVDGAAGAKFYNSTRLVSNSSGTGFQIITYHSAAGCSPDCTDVSGTDLFDSKNITTLELDNSAEGAKTIFYARWSQVTINNSGQIGALVGQTVSLKNSGTITFGTSIEGVGETFWVIDSYRRSYD